MPSLLVNEENSNYEEILFPMENTILSIPEGVIKTYYTVIYDGKYLAIGIDGVSLVRINTDNITWDHISSICYISDPGSKVEVFQKLNNVTVDILNVTSYINKIKDLQNEVVAGIESNKMITSESYYDLIRGKIIAIDALLHDDIGRSILIMLSDHDKVSTKPYHTAIFRFVYDNSYETFVMIHKYFRLTTDAPL